MEPNCLQFHQKKHTPQEPVQTEWVSIWIDFKFFYRVLGSSLFIISETKSLGLGHSTIYKSSNSSFQFNNAVHVSFVITKIAVS
mmetsp:Transcript_35885/g.83688  ORF Transcript_35885/g.83688 Transcript_35885/m.83688 type:complete len:84 (-) Transcript_35885:3136-3387(-)